MKKTLSAILTVLCFGFSLNAEATVTKQLTYSESVVWRCAVRFIRVDKGFKIIERDETNGYMMFEYSDGAVTHVGTLEVFSIEKNSRQYVQVQLNVQQQPKYIESLLFNKFERKLKREYGVAPDASVILSSARPETTESAEVEEVPDNQPSDMEQE